MTVAFSEMAERLATRLLEDAITEALPEYWQRRAQVFEDARPRPGDFNGQATREQVAARDERLAATAEACRQAAAVASSSRPWWLAGGTVSDALEGVA